MRQLFQVILLFITFESNSQEFFSKVFTVPENGTGLINQWPNYLVAVFPTDSLIYAFGYSTDTTFKNIYGTAFYIFDWTGNLIDYYRIKDTNDYEFFGPEGIQTWDGITFYTCFNNHYTEESILKFNRITRSQEVLKITNSVIKNGDILRSNMKPTNDGHLVTASEITIDTTGYNYKIQITKIDTTGKIKWQSILGKATINGFENSCFSNYVDMNGNIYSGVGYNDDVNNGQPAVYQSIFYKLDINGILNNSYNSKLASEGFCNTYDIAQDEKGWFYLSSDYNFNYSPRFPSTNRGYGVVQIFDTSLHYKGFVNLNFDTSYKGQAFYVSFKKIIRSNKKDGFVVGGSLPLIDTSLIFVDSLQGYDTIVWHHELLNIVKVNDSQQIEWRRTYRIRNGKDDGYLYDLKSCPTGGYIIAAASYLDDAREKYGDPYYMPWLLRVDDDGCLIPGCGTVSNKDPESKKEINIYPNPANNYIVLLHSSQEITRYQIVSTEGKIMDDFYSYLQDEQIIIPISHFKHGSYFIRAENKKGSSSTLFVKN